jgi:hypothetical protein
MDPAVTDPPPICGSCAMFLRALAILALPAERQIDWLRSLGLGEPALCDELADEYYQHWLLLPQFVRADLVPEDAAVGLNELNEMLGEMIQPGSDLGSLDSLRTADDWQRVRKKAAECLSTLK